MTKSASISHSERLRRVVFEWASSSTEAGGTLAIIFVLAGVLVMDLPPPMENLPALLGWIPTIIAFGCFAVALVFAGAAYQGHLHQRRAQF